MVRVEFAYLSHLFASASTANVSTMEIKQTCLVRAVRDRYPSPLIFPRSILSFENLTYSRIEGAWVLSGDLMCKQTTSYSAINNRTISSAFLMRFISADYQMWTSGYGKGMV